MKKLSILAFLFATFFFTAFLAAQVQLGKGVQIGFGSESGTIDPALIRGTAVVQTPAATQTITQPAGTLLSVNNFSADTLPSPVTAYGAVGDGTTDNTAAFTTMESASNSEFYLPLGNYKTTQTLLGKRYWGPGRVILGTQIARAGVGSTVENERISDLDGVNVWANSGAGTTTILFLGDSITFGAFSNENQSYFYLLQKMLNDKSGGIGQSSFRTGATLDWWTLAGTTSRGTKGPLHDSVILQPGASMSYTASNVRYIGFWYQRSSGAGTITVSATTIGTIATVPTSGAAANDVFSQTALFGTATVQTYTLTCSVAPCEITGVSGFAHLTPQVSPVILQSDAQSGYTTSDFTSSAVLTSIQAQLTQKASGFYSYVIALGTNDIYNPSVAISSAQYKANLLTIITALAPFGTPILTVPLRAQTGTFAPVLEPFDNYRDAVYQIAREKSLRVVDLSELDLASVNAYQSDGLHPNSVGYAMMADYYWKKLGMAGTTVSDVSYTLPLSAGVTSFGPPYAPPTVTIHNGRAYLSGLLDVTSIAKNTQIATLPSSDTYPSYRKVLNAVSQQDNGSVEILVDSVGTITLFDYSATSIKFVSLDGLSYPISEN